jgi:hypothetical protein
MNPCCKSAAAILLALVAAGAHAHQKQNLYRATVR